MYFLAVRFSDEKIARLFDLARLILQPDFARSSHITLRGPYANKDSARTFSGRDVGQISVLRPSTFFSDVQHTVYLGIGIVGVADFWFKPNYPEGIPHLTIYDGKDRMLAWAALRSLKAFQWGMRLNSTPMKILDSKRPIEEEFLVGYSSLQSTFNLLGQGVPTTEQVKKMSDLDRVIMLNRICTLIHALTHPSSTPK